MASIDIQKMYEAFSGMITTKRFSNNNMFDKNDALAIMDYAEVITVLKDNIKAKGIWLNNIGHIYHRNKDYQKATKNYNNAAELALEFIKQEGDDEYIFKEQM